MNATTHPATCSQADFARILERGRSYVTALKNEGRLVMTEDGQVRVAESLERIKATSGAPERAAAPVQGKTYTEAQDRERFYSAELKRLEYEREVKRLRLAEELATAASDASAIIRQNLEGWADQLPAHIASLGADEARIATFLRQECHAFLGRLSKALSGLAAAAPEHAE